MTFDRLQLVDCVQRACHVACAFVATAFGQSAIDLLSDVGGTFLEPVTKAIKETSFCSGKVWVRPRKDVVETRPYFVFGDLISNLTTGAFVGGLCTAVMTPNWDVSIAMVVGMAIGMAVSLPAGVLLGSLFGALEVFLPVMTTGMVAGMVVGMRSSMVVIAFVDAVWVGGACGVGIVIVTYLANVWIQRGAQRWTT